MKIPPKFSNLFSMRPSDFVPTETLKQFSQLVGQPTIVQAIKDAAHKLGWKENWSASNLQEVLQKTGQWMESMAHPWLNRTLVNSHSGINGTGEFFSSRWSSHRLGNEALEAHAKLASTYVDSTHLNLELNRILLGLTSAQQAIVVPNLSIALWLVAHGLKGSANTYGVRSEWILPRTDCIRLPGMGGFAGGNLRTILDHSGVRVSEIGANKDCSAEDFQSALSGNSQVLLMASPSSNQEQAAAQRAEGIAAARKAGAGICELWIDGALHDLTSLGLGNNAIHSRFDAGVDLVLVPGNGLLGGPECALILGTTSAMEPIAQLTQSLSWNADGVTRGTLLQTLENTQNLEQWMQSPIGRAFSTSMENLKNRAQRLATQLAGSEKIANATVAEKSVRIGAGPWSSYRLNSSVVQLFPKDITPSALAEELQQGEMPVWGNVQSDHLELVLRTIEPDEDRWLVKKLCSSMEVNEIQPS